MGGEPLDAVTWRRSGSEEDLPAKRHPLVSRALRAAHEAATAWRLSYMMPITDPRYLAATEEDVLVDLLLLHMARRDPDREAIDALSRDKGQQEDMLRRAAEFTADAGTQAALAAIHSEVSGTVVADDVPLRLSMSTTSE